jgi:hypothetical protein
MATSDDSEHEGLPEEGIKPDDHVSEPEDPNDRADGYLSAPRSQNQQGDQRREALEAMRRISSDPAWRKQVEDLRKSIASTARITGSPAWQKHVEDLRKSIASITLISMSPAWRKQEEDFRRWITAMSRITGSPAWQKQVEDLRESITAMSLITVIPAWQAQQAELRSALSASLGNPTWSGPQPGAPPRWLDALETSTLHQRVDDLPPDFLSHPSAAFDESALTLAFEGDEPGFLNALPFVYALAPAAIRRKIQYSVAALAVATAFYIVAIVQGDFGEELKMCLGALLAIWSGLNAFLEAIDSIEKAVGDDGDPR